MVDSSERKAVIVSFRLGGTDGVSIEAAKWHRALGALGFVVTTVAGSGSADHILPALAIDATTAPAPGAVAQVLGGAELVVVENLCSLPLNLAAAEAVAEACRGRRTILHHHDLPWQRPSATPAWEVPDDPCWRHVVINELSRAQLAERGIHATTLYNTFDPWEPGPDADGRRALTRAALGVGAGERLVLQPTRALERKNVPAAVALAERLAATYWLLGPAEDGFGPRLGEILRNARCRTIHGPAAIDVRGSVADAYAACDVVTLPSTWEGFGNPALEAAVYRRPLVIGPYPVAEELRRFGFQWFSLDDHEALAAWLENPDVDMLEHNASVAARHFSTRDLPQRLRPILCDLGFVL